MVAKAWILASLSACLAGEAMAAPSQPHNVILFVADGLRSQAVTEDVAPVLAAVRAQGVDFQNSHSLYPTLTTVNASAIATGHGIGDTGDFGNNLFAGFSGPSMKGSPIAVMENDAVLGDINSHFGGNYLNEESFLAAAHAAGFSTAAIGKLGPVAIQDISERSGSGTIIIDDATGHSKDILASPAILTSIGKSGLAEATPDRHANGQKGDWKTPGTHVANIEQQQWYADVATKVVLPRFKKEKKPFVLVYWSRDPDGTQHYEGDSLNSLTPGINGPTSKAAIHNADSNLAELQTALKTLGLDKTTDIIVTADHGFSTVTRDSKTSAAAHKSYSDVVPGTLPPGFLAIDLARALDQPLYDVGGTTPIDWKKGAHPKSVGAFIGRDSSHPAIIVAGNGGSDLLYLADGTKHRFVKRIVRALQNEDYVGGVFVNDSLGSFAGTLPTSAIGLKGLALTPQPSIVVSFRSYDTGCGELCGAEVSDAEYQTGQGSHGSFGRADTHNFMAAIGPDFKSGFVDPAPVSNADLAPTIAKIAGLELPSKGTLKGRVIGESLVDGAPVTTAKTSIQSKPGRHGLTMVLNSQSVGTSTYFDAAGYVGRTFGLQP